MIEDTTVEDNRAGNSSQIVKEEFPEIHILTLKAVNAHIKMFITPLTSQLK